MRIQENQENYNKRFDTRINQPWKTKETTDKSQKQGSDSFGIDGRTNEITLGHKADVTCKI